MSDLPSTWVTTCLGSVIELNPKNVEIPDETLVGFIPMALLGKSYLDSVTFQAKPWAEVKRGYSHFRDGDVLLAKITPCFENGKAGLAIGLPNGIGAGSTEYFVCRPKAGAVNPRYLLAFLKRSEFLSIGATRMTGSVGHKRVPKEYLSESSFPLAPLNEQARIADQLDKLLARIQSCNDRLDAIPALLKRFRQTVLAAATSGALIERDNPGTSWPDTTIGAIAVDLRYGTSKKCDYSSVGTGVLRIPNIADQGRIDIGDLKRAEFDSKEISKLALREGDLLVIRSNGSVDLVGKTSLVTASESGLLFAGYLMRLRVDQAQALPSFIQLCLSAPKQRQYIERIAKSTSGVNNLNAEELRALRLRLPSLTEQAEIVRRAEALFKFADRIEARYIAARTQAQRLSPLLLAKAFRGELVPQDPNDEPTSVLLERIAAEREKAATQPRARKSSAGRKHVRASKENATMHDENVQEHP